MTTGRGGLVLYPALPVSREEGESTDTGPFKPREGIRDTTLRGAGHQGLPPLVADLEFPVEADVEVAHQGRVLVGVYEFQMDV